MKGAPPDRGCASRRDMNVRRSRNESAVMLILMKERLKDVRYQEFEEVSPDCDERLMLQLGLTSFFMSFCCDPGSRKGVSFFASGGLIARSRPSGFISPGSDPVHPFPRQAAAE